MSTKKNQHLNNMSKTPPVVQLELNEILGF